MMMPAFLLFSFVPGGLLLWFGQRIEQRQPAEHAMRRLFYFFLGVFLVLWLGLMALDYGQNSSLLVIGIVPVLTSLLPISYFLWRSTPALRTPSVTTVFAAFVVLLILLNVWFIRFKGGFYLPLLILGSGGVITLAWQVAQGRGLWRWFSWATLGLLLTGVLVNNFGQNASLMAWPEWLRHALDLAETMMLPVVVVALSGWLTYLAMQQPFQGRKFLLGAGVVGLLSVLLVIHTAEVSMVDWATGSLDAVTSMMFMGVSAVAVTLLLAWRLAESRVFIPLLYAGAMTLGLAVLFFTASRFDPQQVMAERAWQVDKAILAYEADHGQYPPELGALFPRYALVVPDPVLFRDQTWCYEGGADYYRFGYIERPAPGAPAELVTQRLYDSAGTPPADGWVCDAQLADYRQRYGVIYLRLQP